MLFSLGLVFLAVVLTSISQVLLKRGADRGKNNRDTVDESLLAPYLNRYTVSAYCLLLLTTIIGVIALQIVPLKLFYAIASLNFVIVAGLSYVFLKEEISVSMILGIGLVVVGVVVFNM